MFAGPQMFNPFSVCYTQDAEQDLPMQQAFDPSSYAMGLPMHGFFAGQGRIQPQLSTSAMYLPDGFPAYFAGGGLAHSLMLHRTGPATNGPNTADEIPASSADTVPSRRMQNSSRIVPSRPATAPPKPWISHMLKSSFFQSCEHHKCSKKNECTMFCVTCANGPHAMCQYCMEDHHGHEVIQIRRYVYCDVIRTSDISQYLDISGVQSYIINQSKVAFLNPRPQSKIGRPLAPDTCRTCARHLREGSAYCCLACKVSALEQGDSWTPPDADGGEQPFPDREAAAGRPADVPVPRTAHVVWHGHQQQVSRSPQEDATKGLARRPPVSANRVELSVPPPVIRPVAVRGAHSNNGTSSSSSSEAYLAPAAATCFPISQQAIASGMTPATMALLHVVSEPVEQHDARKHGNVTKRPAKLLRVEHFPNATCETPCYASAGLLTALDSAEQQPQPSGSSDSEGGCLQPNTGAGGLKLATRPTGSLRRKRQPQRSPE